MKPIKASKGKRRREIAELFDGRSGRKWERDAENALIDLEEKVDENYKWAEEIVLLQDLPTRQAIEDMQAVMIKMAGRPVYRFRGQPWPMDEAKARTIQERNMLWAAVRLCVACARWDIRIANFKLPTNRCGVCGKQTRRSK